MRVGDRMYHVDDFFWWELGVLHVFVDGYFELRVVDLLCEDSPTYLLDDPGYGLLVPMHVIKYFELVEELVEPSYVVRLERHLALHVMQGHRLALIRQYLMDQLIRA